MLSAGFTLTRSPGLNLDVLFFLILLKILCNALSSKNDKKYY